MSYLYQLHLKLYLQRKISIALTSVKRSWPISNRVRIKYSIFCLCGFLHSPNIFHATMTNVIIINYILQSMCKFIKVFAVQHIESDMAYMIPCGWKQMIKTFLYAYIFVEVRILDMLHCAKPIYKNDHIICEMDLTMYISGSYRWCRALTTIDCNHCCTNELKAAMNFNQHFIWACS